MFLTVISTDDIRRGLGVVFFFGGELNTTDRQTDRQTDTHTHTHTETHTDTHRHTQTHTDSAR